MFKIDDYVNQFTDIMSEGLIFIDDKGIIQIYNNKAKEIFGIINKFDYSHDSGTIEKGDIVMSETLAFPTSLFPAKIYASEKMLVFPFSKINS